MIKYIIVIILIISWYNLLFRKDKILSNKVNKLNRNFIRSAKTLDKRTIEEKVVQSRKIMTKMSNLKLLSKTFKEDIKDDCQTLGIYNIDEYLSKLFNVSFSQIKMFSVMFLFSLIIPVGAHLIMDTSTATGAVIAKLSFLFPAFPLVQMAFSSYAMLGLKRTLKSKVKAHVAQIERDYYLLFDHFYFYYGFDSNQRRPLPKILGKFTYNISDDMRILIDSLLNDCKVSEIYALGNMQRRYRSSLKVSELASKLVACINNKPLSKDNLNALREQIKSERLIKDSIEDEKVTGKFVRVMVICMSVIVIVSIVGTLTQLI